MGQIADMLMSRNFVIVARTTVPQDAQINRPNHEKLIGETIYIPAEVREELGLRL